MIAIVMQDSNDKMVSVEDGLGIEGYAKLSASSSIRGRLSALFLLLLIRKILHDLNSIVPKV